MRDWAEERHPSEVGRGDFSSPSDILNNHIHVLLVEENSVNTSLFQRHSGDTKMYSEEKT